ncbi:MAG TPA: CPBP family intramembrane glutamic endopeptidase [Candidatus Didemnitutus sp.]|nr:CPBP family intramembrane glutamic endopeptidase [Candidatus Didemnitutus sp.]
MIDLQSHQDAVYVGEGVIELAGLFLLGRYAFSPTFRKKIRSREPLPRWRISAFDFALLLLVATLLAFVGTLALTAVWRAVYSTAANREGIAVIASGLGLDGCALLVWPILRTFLRQLTPELGEHPGLKPFERPLRSTVSGAMARGAAAFAVALPIVSLSSILWSMCLHWLGLPEGPQELIGIFNRTHSPLVMTGMLVVACILAPINEEVIFRRSIYHFIRDRLGRSRAVVISALIFGAVHANWYSAVPLAVFAVVLALSYEITGDIRVPIIAHALFNLNTIIGIFAGLPQ